VEILLSAIEYPAPSPVQVSSLSTKSKSIQSLPPLKRLISGVDTKKSVRPTFHA